MATPFAVTIPHQLTQADAKARLVSGIADARQKYGSYLTGMTETWNGNRMEFAGSVMSQRITGRVDVDTDNVRVEVDLPMMLALLAKKFLPKVEAEGRKMLEKK